MVFILNTIWVNVDLKAEKRILIGTINLLFLIYDKVFSLFSFINFRSVFNSPNSLVEWVGSPEIFRADSSARKVFERKLLFVSAMLHMWVYWHLSENNSVPFLRRQLLHEMSSIPSYLKQNDRFKVWLKKHQVV